MGLVPKFFSFFICGLFFSLNAAAKDIVFVSILPQKFFIEQITEEFIDVKVMVEPGQVPETYEPSQRKMADLAQAKLFFAIGLPFEKKLTGLIHRDRFVLTAAENPERAAELEHGEEEHSDEHGHHQHHDDDPHIWLDPVQVKQQAKIIYEHLVEVFPDKKTQFQANYQRFVRQLNELNKKIEAQLSADKGRHFLIFHPALGHYAERYHLEQVAIENEGKLPSAKYLAGLLGQLKSHRVKFILVEKQFSQKEAQTIARQLAASLLVIDPLAYSYFSNMQDITDSVEKSLY